MGDGQGRCHERHRSLHLDPDRLPRANTLGSQQQGDLERSGVQLSVGHRSFAVRDRDSVAVSLDRGLEEIPEPRCLRVAPFRRVELTNQPMAIRLIEKWETVKSSIRLGQSGFCHLGEGPGQGGPGLDVEDVVTEVEGAADRSTNCVHLEKQVELARRAPNRHSGFGESREVVAASERPLVELEHHLEERCVAGIASWGDGSHDLLERHRGMVERRQHLGPNDGYLIDE